ncbi:MAG: hypothetical protein EWM72_00547 [Nitrospira sp.]|nr:MAG: hypothetical protein EWM72_00547 [Nitrospira sp.]
MCLPGSAERQDDVTLPQSRPRLHDIHRSPSSSRTTGSPTCEPRTTASQAWYGVKAARNAHHSRRVEPRCRGCEAVVRGSLICKMAKPGGGRSAAAVRPGRSEQVMQQGDGLLQGWYHLAL